MLSYMVALGILLVGGHMPGLGHAQGQTAEPETWGNPFRGVAISVKPNKAQYELGEQIDVWVRFKNVSDEEVALLDSTYPVSYKICLFYADGSPVPKSREAIRSEAPLDPRSMGHVSTVTTRLRPREMPPWWKVFTLNPLFQIDEEGTYFVVVMHKLRSWNEGFAISNLAKFRVISPKDNKDSDAEPSKAEAANPH